MYAIFELLAEGNAFVVFAVIFLAIFFSIILLVGFFLFFRPWLQCFLAGSPMSLVSIVAMRLRGTPVMMLVSVHIAFTQRRQPQSFQAIESFYVGHKHEIYDEASFIKAFESSDMFQKPDVDEMA